MTMVYPFLSATTKFFLPDTDTASISELLASTQICVHVPSMSVWTSGNVCITVEDFVLKSIIIFDGLLLEIDRVWSKSLKVLHPPKYCPHPIPELHGSTYTSTDPMSKTSPHLSCTQHWSAEHCSSVQSCGLLGLGTQLFA